LFTLRTGRRLDGERGGVSTGVNWSIMTDPQSDDIEDTETGASLDVTTAAAPVTSSYKILGQFEDPNGSAILGQNDSQSGAPVAVEGAVPNANGYGFSTPDDARIDGRVDSTSTHELWVAGRRQLGLEPAAADYLGNTGSGNVVGGLSFADDGVVGAAIGNGGRLSNTNQVYDDYTTIGGGEGNQAGRTGRSGTGNAVYATVAGGLNNTANDEYATVGGGLANTASYESTVVGGGTSNAAKDYEATVAGGEGNTARGSYSTVAGGQDNTALDNYTAIGGGEGNQAGESGGIVESHGTVPGGFKNLAEGERTFAAGHKAKAVDNYAFVWSDKAGSDFNGTPFTSSQTGTSSSPTGNNTFHARATGGVRFVTGLNSSDEPNAGSYLASGGSSWQSVSAASAKHDVRPVDPQSVLDGVASLSISRWAYDGRPGVDRMGPMAGEFHDAFELGDDPETIGHVDADGVALAAIQGLAERLAETREDLDEMADRDEQVDSLEAENERLRTENERLRERVDAIEDRLGIDR